MNLHGQLSEECERLNELAFELYESGDHGGARRLWSEVLKISPQDERALEGQRLLSAGADGGGETEAPQKTRGGDELAHRIAGVEALLEDGRVIEAVVEAQQLLDEHPDAPEVQGIHAVAMRAYEAEPFLREHLNAARESLDAGDFEKARACCAKALELDETNHEAAELMAEIEAEAQDRDEAYPPADDTVEAVEADASGAPPPFAGDGPSGSIEPQPPAPTEAPSDVLDLSFGGFDLEELDAGAEAPETQAPTRDEAAPDAAQEAEGSLEFLDEEQLPSIPFDDDDDAAPGASAAASGGRDMGTAAGQGPPEGAEEGVDVPAMLDRARIELGAGRPDQAISLASRVLAAEPDNAQAAELIEQARELIDQQGREIERLMIEAHACFDRNARDGAEQFLRKVLEIRPDHGEARDLLARISPTGQAEGALTSQADVEAAPIAAEIRLDRSARPGAAGATGAGAEEMGAILPDARRSESRPTAPRKRPPVRAGGGGRLLSTGRLVALAVIVAAAGGAWYGYRTFNKWIGDAPSQAPAASPQNPGPDSRVKQAMPRQATMERPRQAPAPQKSAAQLSREGREALQAGRFAEAVASLRAAVAAEPTDPETRALLVQAAEKYDKEQEGAKQLEEATRAFSEGRYEDCLRVAYRLPESRQEGADIQRMMRNAWFNIAVEDLRSRDCRSAIAHFGEVLAISAGDSQAIEGRKMAEAYLNRQKDEAYIRFAASLPARGLDAR